MSKHSIRRVLFARSYKITCCVLLLTYRYNIIKLKNKTPPKGGKIIWRACIEFGGDDESVIYATDWEEKTRIRTCTGLEKAVKITNK